MSQKMRSGWINLHGKHEAHPVNIVADAAIATKRIGEGRLIPLLILDTSERPDLEELIRVHEHLPPGDVKIQWGKLTRFDKNVILILSFQRPIESVAILKFDIVEQGILVDQMLATNALYLQAGREGDRFAMNPYAPKIFVEIPDTGFRDAWDKMYRKYIAKHMRERGLKRRQAKKASGEFINQLREFGQFRMGERRQRSKEQSSSTPLE